jgi:hypothetical protein
MTAQEAPDAVMRDQGDPGRGQRSQAVVHHLHIQALQIRDVAGKVKPRDLPLAVGDQLVAAHEAFEHERAFRRSVALPNDVPIGIKGFDRDRQCQQALPVFSREIDNALQLAEETLLFRA